ncbi:MAG: glycosyl hydrolase family 28 protein [Bacteroidota bacterium]
MLRFIIISSMLLCLVACRVNQEAPASTDVATASVTQHLFSVKDFGAVGDGHTNDTEAIQLAVDQIVAAGGGSLIFPAGNYLSGMVELGSNLEIILQAGCIWQAIPEAELYPDLQFSTADLSQSEGFTMTRKAFIIGRNIENFSLRGPGQIHPQGERHDAFPAHESNGAKRPYGIYLIDSKQIRISNIELRNSAFWMLRLYRCDDVQLNGIRIWNHANTNNDGIDIVDCHRVTVSDCVIDSSDDALCLKSEAPRGCRDIVITNCLISSTASYLKLGTASFGSFEGITISNCVLRTTRAREIIHGLQIPQGITGLAVMSADGAKIANVSFNNIVMEGLSCPIFVRLGNRHRYTHQEYADLPITPGEVKNLSFSNITASGVGALPIVIAGYPGHPVEGVRLNNVVIDATRAGKPSDLSPVEENDRGYPSPLMWGTNLPAAGLFVRYANDVHLRDVFWTSAGEDPRPAIYAEEADLNLAGVYFNGSLVEER